MAVEIETSTDTVEEVKEALGATVEIEESPAAEEPAQEKPAAKAKPAAEEAEAEEEATEEEAEPEQDEPEEPEAAKAKPEDMVPRSRLNKEIRRRQEAERLNTERSTSKEEPEEEAAADQVPQNFSGKPEPQLDDFIKNIDEFDNKAMAKATATFTTAYTAWVREEARAEALYYVRLEDARRQEKARVAPFMERRDAYVEDHPEYDDIVTNSKVELNGYQEQFVYDSKVGPQLLMHFAQHPRDAARIRNMGFDQQSDAMLKLQAKFLAEVDTESEELTDDEEEPAPRPTASTVPPRKASTPPPKKTASTAPAPPSRIRSTGPQPKTEEELAGPADRTGVDIEYNPEYTKAVLARRKHS